MARRRSNGEGTIYRRKDGRYEGAAYVLTTSGTTKRVRVYGATRAEVDEKLTDLKARNYKGAAVADKAWKLGAYLDYWLAEIVKPNLRLSTYERYETAVRLYLKPGLGDNTLTRLSIPTVQAFLNQRRADGMSVRSAQILREVLRSALARANEEQLVARNVATLVKLPKWERAEVSPWSAEEARAFLIGARSDALYPAFVLMVLYGLRRGEVLGLRWCDVDFEHAEIRIRQQVQRLAGELHQGPVKTASGRRNLPMLDLSREVLLAHRQVNSSEDLVFATRTGRPTEPRNFVRSFKRICSKADVRIITIHQVRHSTATLLKDLRVPARDVQLILGHSDITTTQQIYQHSNMEGRREALSLVETVLRRSLETTDQTGSEGSRQLSRQHVSFSTLASSVLSVTQGRLWTRDTNPPKPGVVGSSPAAPAR